MSLSHLHQLSSRDARKGVSSLQAYVRLFKMSKKHALRLWKEKYLSSVRVEIQYAGKLSDRLAEELTGLYNRSFGKNFSAQEISWNQQDHLAGGARFFYGDEMVNIALSSLAARFHV